MAFGTILKTPAKTDSQKRITELAHLALARIYLRPRPVHQRARRVRQDRAPRASYFNDALYESAWVSIKGKDYDKAARALDLLLLNAPDSPLVPEVKLLIGSLHIRENAYGPATDTFTKTRDEYEPVHRQLDDALTKTGDAPLYFRDLITQEPDQVRHRRDPAAGARSSGCKGEPDVQRVATLIGDESELQEVARRVGGDRPPSREGDDRAGARQRLPRAGDGARQVDRGVQRGLGRQRGARRARVAADRRRSAAPSRSSRRLEAERDALEQKLRALPVDAESIEQRQQQARGAVQRARQARRRAADRAQRHCAPRRWRRASSTRTRCTRRCRPSSRRARRRSSTARIAEIEARGRRQPSALRKDLDDAKHVGRRRRRRHAAAQAAARSSTTTCSRRLHDLDVRVRSRLSARRSRARPSRSSRSSTARAASRARSTAFNGRIDDARRARSRICMTELADEKAQDRGLSPAARRLHHRVGRRRRRHHGRELQGGHAALLQRRRARRRRHHRRRVGAQGLVDREHQPPGRRAQARAQAARRRIQVGVAQGRSHERANGVERLALWRWRSWWRCRWRARGRRHGRCRGRTRARSSTRSRSEIGRFEDASQGLPRHRHARRAAGVRREAQAADDEVPGAARHRGEGREVAPRRRPSSCSRTSSPSITTTIAGRPDAMFRLAELYFEKSNDEYLTATAGGGRLGRADHARLQTTIDALQGSDHALPQLSPHRRRLLPARLVPRRNEQGGRVAAGDARARLQQQVQAARSAAAAAPSKGKAAAKVENPYADCKPVKDDSRFLPEAWTRVGEYHFDNSELELAIAAYTRVLDFKDSPYFDKALYKLAWSYYRADKYPEAIKRFDELVVFSDKKKAESGAEGSDLRTESVQYLGISFAEKDWNGDSIDDPETGPRARREVLPRARDRAARARDLRQARRHLLRRDRVLPRHRGLQAHARQVALPPGQPEAAGSRGHGVRAAARLRRTRSRSARRWRATTPRAPSGTSTTATTRRRSRPRQELAELALVSAAVNHHKAAQDLKKMAAAQKRPDAKLLEQHRQGVHAGGRGLREVPRAVSELEEHLRVLVLVRGDALLLGSLPRRGAWPYEKVRDSKLDNKYVEDAAFNAVKSYEKAVDRADAEGRVSRAAAAGRRQDPDAGDADADPRAGEQAAARLRRVRRSACPARAACRP